MDAFSQLRKQAREKRDKLISFATDQYSATLTRIAALEQDLLGHQPSDHKTVSSCVESVLPKDRPFTTIDVKAALEAIDPSKPWYMRTISNQLTRLRHRGLIRRLSKASIKRPAVYARIECSTAPQPFEDQTLLDVASEVLRVQQMNQTELAVAILEAGYQTAMKPKALRHSLAVALRRDKRFVQKYGKWGMVETVENC